MDIAFIRMPNQKGLVKAIRKFIGDAPATNAFNAWLEQQHKL